VLGFGFGQLVLASGLVSIEPREDRSRWVSLGAEGTGWWLASDGRWYPPESHPSYRVPAAIASSQPWQSGPHADLRDPSSSARTQPRTGNLNVWIVSLLCGVVLLVAGGGALALWGGSSAGTGGPPPGTRFAAVNPPAIGGTVPTQAPPTTPATTIPPPPAPATGSLVTPQVESAVVDTTWNAFADAFAEDNTSALQTTATQSVAQVVQGWFTCGCAPWPVAVSHVSYSAPPQSAYPIYFFAEIEGTLYDGTPLIKEVVFSQTGPTQPWLVAYLGGFVGAGPLLGSAQNVQTGPGHVSSAITKAPEDFAEFFQTLDQTGKTPALPDGFRNDGIMKEAITGSEQSYDDRQHAHLSDAYVHSVADVSPVFASPYGDLVCITMDIGDVVTPGQGSTIRQPTNRSQWGNLLAPGAYSSVNIRSVFDVCFFKETDGPVLVVSNMGGPISITGK
jgi:hypothetical protein